MLNQYVQDWLEVWGDRFDAPEIQNPWELKTWAEKKLQEKRDPLLRMTLEDLLERLEASQLQ